jgi:hypothetical protein
MKFFRSDNAMEYCESTFLTTLKQNGTLPHRSCPNTSQQNGRAERKHRHILDTVRALLLSVSIHKHFWGEAALTAIYTINRVPSPTTLNWSPYELLHGSPPDYRSFRIFGCVCFVLLPPHERTKLEPHSRLCCFLGYGIEHKGYRCYDPISKRLRISRHVTFWEHRFFGSMESFPSSPSSSSPVFTNISFDLLPETTNLDAGMRSSPDDITTINPNAPAPPIDPPAIDPDISVPHCSTRVTALPSHFRDYHCYFALVTIHEPRSFREAHTNLLWQNAMSEELNALSKTHTWDLVDLPHGKTAVRCKWIFKIKTKSDGSIERYKARLVAKGFNQEYGIDYEETFAPVARLTSVRSLLAVAFVHRWDLFQMDVKNAFLNGDLGEEVYMQPPPGYDHLPHKVCRLRRALYGLKQAPRLWFAKFSSTIAQIGFVSSPYDSALFIWRSDAGLILLLLYVDDMIIVGDDTIDICNLQQFLSQQFEMKDLGSLSYFLGLEVSSDQNGYYFSQAKYASDLLS